MFHGFVGPGLGDAAACGGVFAAPSPDIIVAAARAAHRGRGILFLYGNYAGDNMKEALNKSIQDLSERAS